MPCTHEFGIIDEFDHTKTFYEYEPQKYNCISVDDDLINALNANLLTMRTYYHSYDRHEYGLALYGITIIPPESLPFFYDVVTSSEYAKELQELAVKIAEAKEQNKYMIHFGV